MTEALRVAAVIPARDGLPDVLDAVDTALQQSAPCTEIVVADGGSEDGTASALHHAFGDAVRVIEGRFASAAAARNAAWRATTAPWIAFLDADDLWFPDKLAVAAEALAARPQAGWFFSDGAFRTLTGDVESSWLSRHADLPDDYFGRPVAELLEVNFILTSSVMVRRDLLEQCGGFDESLPHAEDLDLWIRLARRAPATASRRALVRYQHRPRGLPQQVHARLVADAEVFQRLASDPSISARLRRRARRRESFAHYRLAIDDLREARGSEARAHLAVSLGSADRVVPVLAAFGASLLPARWMRRLRRQRWMVRGIGAPMLRSGRVAVGRTPGFDIVDPAAERG